MAGGKNKRTYNRTILPALKNNAAAGYQGPMKIELLKVAGLLLGEDAEISVYYLKFMAISKLSADFTGFISRHFLTFYGLKFLVIYPLGR